MKPKTSWDESK